MRAHTTTHSNLHLTLIVVDRHPFIILFLMIVVQPITRVYYVKSRWAMGYHLMMIGERSFLVSNPHLPFVDMRVCSTTTIGDDNVNDPALRIYGGVSTTQFESSVTVSGDVSLALSESTSMSVSIPPYDNSGDYIVIGDKLDDYGGMLDATEQLLDGLDLK